MDKNKSAYKLKDFGPVYYLNLDGQPERRAYMEQQFKYWEVTNYERISAYDGRDDDLGGILKGRYPDLMTSGEVGCTTSHLKALKHFLETSDSPYAIIMEDDCSLDLVAYWNFTWKELFARVPYDYDVFQISIICTGDIHVKLHKRFVNLTFLLLAMLLHDTTQRNLFVHIVEERSINSIKELNLEQLLMTLSITQVTLSLCLFSYTRLS